MFDRHFACFSPSANLCVLFARRRDAAGLRQAQRLRRQALCLGLVSAVNDLRFPARSTNPAAPLEARDTA